VSAVVRVVERRPHADLIAFADVAELIAAVDRAAPIRTIAGPTRGVLYASGPAAVALGEAVDRGEHGARRRVDTLAGALPAGVTMSVDVQRLLPEAYTEEALVLRSGAFVQVHRPQSAETLELVVIVTTDALERELALVRLPADFRAGTLAVVVPWPAASRDGAAVVVSLEIGPAPPPDTPAGRAHALTLRRCLDDIARHGLPAAPPDTLPPGILSALRGLLDATPLRAVSSTGSLPGSLPGSRAEGRAAAGDTAGQRGTLQYLAASTGAQLARDIALSAEPEIVDALARALLAAGSEHATVGETTAALGALLERHAYLLLLDDAGLEDVPPGREALLALHAGEVGRDGALLEELLSDSPSLSTLAARITSENVTFLDHGSPASRVRAYDWLAARGREPAGYDPLATRDARRQALADAGMLAAP
jgi:hypothetical protein